MLMTASPVAFGRVSPTVSESKIRIRTHPLRWGTRAITTNARSETAGTVANDGALPPVLREPDEAFRAAQRDGHHSTLPQRHGAGFLHLARATTASSGAREERACALDIPHEQFGQGYERMRDFRRVYVHTSSK